MLKKGIMKLFRIHIHRWILFGSFVIFVKILHANQFPVITYYFEVNETNWNSASISISIENNSMNRLLVFLPATSESNFQLDKVSVKISNFEVSGEGINEPTFKQIDVKSFLIFANGNRTIVINYKISNLKSYVLGSLISKEFIFIDNPLYFMAIREYRDYPIKLTINVPYGWKLATGLPYAGDNFEYSALNYEQLSKHPLFLAPFKEIYFTYYNQNHFVIFNRNTNLALADKITQFCQKIFLKQASFFKEIPKQRHFFIFDFTTTFRTVKSGSYENLSIFFVPKNFQPEQLNLLKEKVSSALCQQWYREILPTTIDFPNHNPAPKNLWFWTGLSRFYGKLFLLKLNEIDMNVYAASIIENINKALLHVELFRNPLYQMQRDLMEGEWDEDIYGTFILKSELLCTILDLKIRSVSKNSRSLDDVILFLRTWSKLLPEFDSDAHLQKFFTSMTNVDFTSFLDMYVYGSLDFPFMEALEQGGIFATSFADTVPDFSGMKVEGNRISELPEKLKKAGLKIGDKLISVGGMQLSEDLNFSQIVDSLKVGKKCDFLISRDGLSVLVNIQVPGKKVQQFNLISSEPKSELQMEIRKKWLQ